MKHTFVSLRPRFLFNEADLFRSPHMEPLSTFVGQVSPKIAYKDLCDCMDFSGTDRLRARLDNAVVQVDQETLDLDGLTTLATHSAALAVRGGHDDLLVVLKALKQATTDLNLNWMNGLLFHHRGLDLLAVRITNNDCDQYAYLDIGRYYKRLVSRAALADRDTRKPAVPNAKSKSKGTQSTYVNMGILVGILLACFAMGYLAASVSGPVANWELRQ